MQPTAATHAASPSTRPPMGPAAARRARRLHGPARLMQFLPAETPVESANRELKDTIRAATVGADEARTELLVELLHGAHLADSEVNVAVFASVRDDIVVGKVASFADLGRRIRSLVFLSDRVLHALNALEEEERARSAALLAPKARKPNA